MARSLVGRMDIRCDLFFAWGKHVVLWGWRGGTPSWDGFPRDVGCEACYLKVYELSRGEKQRVGGGTSREHVLIIFQASLGAYLLSTKALEGT